MPIYTIQVNVSGQRYNTSYTVIWLDTEIALKKKKKIYKDSVNSSNHTEILSEITALVHALLIQEKIKKRKKRFFFFSKNVLVGIQFGYHYFI